jgi:phospholipase C
MDSRREFLKKASLLSGAGLINMLPSSIARALAIDPVAGSSFLDAEHVVFLMQENRSFDHTYGTLQGVRGFNDPRAISLPNKNPVWLQTNAKGETYAPFRLNMKDTRATWMSSLPHSWWDQVDARNDGKYDKWLEVKASGHKDYKQMPLTMGYYNREDIPFYYALADAFTVCDHNFCSSLTGTTPNRLYFWTGTIREKHSGEVEAKVWNSDADHDRMVSWKTFPERLEENNISWKVYQNEISIGVGFEGEEDSWLANFTDNPLEFFTQYNVRLSKEFIQNLPKEEKKLEEEIARMESAPAAASTEENERKTKRIAQLKTRLEKNRQDQQHYTLEKYEKLSAFEKNLHDKAFSTNRKDPDYHSLTTVEYDDNGIKRQVQIPKGDILHEFREDVNNGKLPAVSWIVAPENFSDHPSSAWYGAWYISEVMDILTKDPEVWKKTIFVLTYDENDGYYDHMPPFVCPAPSKNEAGLVSKGIDTAEEYVTHERQSVKDRSRESPIGLGYRVPLVIASPWSRGGYVCSQVFDHSSSLQFLEKFLSHKTGKKIEEPNIGEWRRTVCGDLVSAFRPYNGEKLDYPRPVNKKAFIETIHKAKFKNPPSNYRDLTPEEIKSIAKDPNRSALLPAQEKGTRPANALPYELYSNARVSGERNLFELDLSATNKRNAKATAGAPFTVYAPGIYKGQAMQVRSYAVKTGDLLKDQWNIKDFENGIYLLRVYGPNGFFREFKGSEKDHPLEISCGYDISGTTSKTLCSLHLKLKNAGSTAVTIEVKDNAYRMQPVTKTLRPSGNTKGEDLIIDLSGSHNWYDISIRIKGNAEFLYRYAGHIETGRDSRTDPFMGREI